MSETTCIEGYLPGLIGDIAALHGRLYSDTHDFGAFFEGRVARELAAFVDRYDPAQDYLRTVVRDQRVLGSIVVDGSGMSEGVAHLRWFILDPELRGIGYGQSLFEGALGFARRAGYSQVVLWTLADLAAASRLYEKAGFRVVEELRGTQWGREVGERRLLLDL